VNANRTIPADLDDWLHNFRPSLEHHGSPKTIMAGGNRGEQNDQEAPQPLAAASDHLTLCFAA
jgi:hypothetical protein